MVKERPILFSGPMVNAILEGRKTMTRRVVPDKYLKWNLETRELCNHTWPAKRVGACCPDCYGELLQKSPYGQPGDRLWVRETCWLAHPNFSETSWNRIDNNGLRREVGYDASMSGESTECAIEYGIKKTPSIHMPRWASRITLEITHITVQRLQDISEIDALKEGFSPDTAGTAIYPEVIPAACEFQAYWNSLAKPGTKWVDNPWVWVVEFKVLETERHATP